MRDFGPCCHGDGARNHAAAYDASFHCAGKTPENRWANLAHKAFHLQKIAILLKRCLRGAWGRRTRFTCLYAARSTRNADGNKKR
jgi:hypothetical protein